MLLAKQCILTISMFSDGDRKQNTAFKDERHREDAMKKMYLAAAGGALLAIYSIAAFAQAPAAAPGAAPAQ
ncbi:MAG: hypothetical protein J0I28_12755, partial [Caulobacterales bacterium]|nr:hypothetical protein [Caulobacterales bacterium]